MCLLEAAATRERTGNRRDGERFLQKGERERDGYRYRYRERERERAGEREEKKIEDRQVPGW